MKERPRKCAQRTAPATPVDLVPIDRYNEEIEATRAEAGHLKRGAVIFARHF